MKNSIQRLTVCGLLIAVGIVIPMFSPVRITLEPASFTLASHVAIFIAMTFSPGMAAAVAAGTAIGFFLGGFTPVIVLRAASHLVFAVAGAIYLKKHARTLESPAKARAFSLVIGLIHGATEVVVVTLFYLGGVSDQRFYEHGYLWSVIFLVGLGSAIHSMVDFEISLIIVKALSRQKGHPRPIS